MKQANEYIKLRMYSSEQAICIVKCLDENGYHEFITGGNEPSVKYLERMFNPKRPEKVFWRIYVEIDNETKDYRIVSEVTDLVGTRWDKLKKIMNGHDE